jgi:hypothetical protein
MLDVTYDLGPLVLLAGIAACIVLYLRRRRAAPSVAADSAPRFFGLAMLVGIVAWLLGTVIGIYAACSASGAGNLCGLYGVFGVGPMCAGIAIFAYAIVRRRL